MIPALVNLNFYFFFLYNLNALSKLGIYKNALTLVYISLQRMKILKLCVLSCLSLFIGKGLVAQKHLQLHKRAIVCDTHNDIISVCIEKNYAFDTDLNGKTHSDLDRMKKGGLDVQVFSIFCDGTEKEPFKFANQEIDSVYAWAERNPDKMAVIKNVKELKKNVKQNKLVALIGVEGGHMIEDDLNKLEALYNRGTRYMTLTWNNNPTWASSAAYETGEKSPKQIDTTQAKGLNEFGKQVIKKMNQLGMIIDMSHVGEQTFYEAMAITTKPVIASHSNAYALCRVYRNLKDEQLKAIAKNNGVIQLNFYAAFIDTAAGTQLINFNKRHRPERDELVKSGIEKFVADDSIFVKYAAEVEAMQPPLSKLLDHLDYIVKLVGVSHVGLGGDFDGISLTPKQLTDVTQYPNITKELLVRGYSKKEIKKILGGNFLRVLKANEN